jgi:carbonic anhydrase
MRELQALFENNRRWALQTERSQPGFFQKLAEQQAPPFLWIGCSDSRVPANQIVDLPPGEVFVHRNIANQVIPDDLNAGCVLEYAVDVLQVRHVIVCGHYGCGGVMAACEHRPMGRLDHWLKHIQQVEDRYRTPLQTFTEASERLRRMCELNVIEQVRHLCETDTIGEAWKRGQAVTLHGWIYDVRDGLLRDLNACVTSIDDAHRMLDEAAQRCLEARHA